MLEICEMIFGLIIGYIATSICEALSHKYIGHSEKSLRKIVIRFPIIGALYKRSWFGHHVLHHRLTYFNDFSQQFESQAHKRKIDKILINKKYYKYFRTNYGLKVGNIGDMFMFTLPSLIVMIIIIIISYNIYGSVFFVMAMGASIILMPLVSQFIHPLLHEKENKNQTNYSAVVQIIIKSRYFYYIKICHWLHHRHDDCNYNLLPIGDYILGFYRPPSCAETDEMKAAGII